MRCLASRMLIISLVLLSAPATQAALDPTQWRPELAETPVWWDNIEGAPFWRRGPKPKWHRDWKMHAVALQPGETVVLRLPPGRALRVYHPGGLTPRDLHIGLDNGSGLRVFPSLQTAGDPPSLLLSPSAPGPFEAYISLPPQRQETLRLALFLSRYESWPAAPYRDVGAFDLPTTRLHTELYGPAERFWRLQPYALAQTRIVGPAHLALENRFIYDAAMHRLKQTYRIETRLDNAPLRVLEFATNTQISQPVFSDGNPQPVGRLEVDYVEIPPGVHTLALYSTAPVYLRLLRQSDADYLLPRMNRPPLQQSARAASSLLYTPLWQLDPPSLQRAIASPANSVAELEYLAKRLWLDNRHRDGGLQAAMLLQDAAARRPHDALLQQSAARQQSASTLYRHLLPARKTEAQPQRLGWFETPRLAPLDHRPEPYAAAAQHQADLTAQLKAGYFVPLPTVPHINDYILPPRTAPSVLRLVADLSALTQPQEIWLQYDPEPPTRMRLTPPSAAAKHEALLSLSDVGLALLRRQNPDFDHATLGGPFSIQAPPAPQLRTAYAALPLPAQVQRIRVWQAGNRAEPLSVALQYLVSRPFELSERSYLEALQRLGSDAARQTLLRQQLSALAHGPATFDASAYTQREAIDMVNHWQPLMRLLRDRYQRFVEAVSPLTPPPVEPPQVNVGRWRARAQQAEISGDWLAALEAWGPIAKTAHGAPRREARMGQARALQLLGRRALADQLLRGIMLFDADADLRLQAFNHLLDTYRRSEDDSAIRGLLAAATIRRHHPEALRLLIAQFTADGQDQHALTLGLALPVSQRPLASLLQSAWRLGWRQAFQALAQQLESAEERHYWLGYHAIQQADYHSAQQHFLQAGRQGQAVAEAIQQARRIHVELRSPDAAAREMAAWRWEAWQGRHPGPHVWRREPQLVADYAGSMVLYQPSLDARSQWYRSDANKPVQLRFLGPLRLRLAARPLHPQAVDDAHAAPFDGWIQVDHGAQPHWIPIIGNQPTPHLRALDGGPWQPGQRIMDVLAFGPGLHTVIITGQKIPLLIQTEVQRPALPLGILPPLTPDTLLALLQPQPDAPHVHTPPRRDGAAGLYLTDAPKASRPILIEIASAGDASPAAPAGRDDLVNLQQRLRLRRPQPAAEPPRLYDDKAERRQRMTLLLRQAERQPERYEAALSAAQALLAAHPEPPLFALFAHMTRRSQWQRITTAQHSAGLHYIEHQGWRPESPFMRASQALLRSPAPDEHIVTGRERLLMALDNLNPATFVITLQADELPYTHPIPLTATYQVDEQAPTSIALTSGAQRQSLRLVIPAGQHALRFYIQEPQVNQFLRLRIIEQHPLTDRPLARAFERAYHVATQTEPVEVLLAGPSWLRVDRWRQDGIRTHYQPIAPGWQTVKLYPEPGQREALLRLFQRLPAPASAPANPRRPHHEPAVEPTPLAQAPQPRQSRAALHDAYPLGGQEDGTWTFSSQLVSRRNTQEDVGLVEDERFAALSATHRYADAFRDLYFETEAIARGRADGGPTLGLRHVLAYRPPGRELTLRVSGAMFAQLPALDTDGAASGLFRLAASRRFDLGSRASHLPSMSLLARLLSLDTSQARKITGRIDLDVYSAFKADHRIGLNLTDTFAYQPWLDTAWLGTLNVVTNQDFNPLQPDHLTFQLEWRQLLGPLQLHSAYRFGYFFADDDRRQAIDRHTLILEANWEHWRPSRRRFEVGGHLRYDLRSGDMSFLLGVSWDASAGRAYRDFRPGAIPFRRLRQYRIPQGRRNRLSYVETR